MGGTATLVLRPAAETRPPPSASPPLAPRSYATADPSFLTYDSIFTPAPATFSGGYSSMEGGGVCAPPTSSPGYDPAALLTLAPNPPAAAATAGRSTSAGTQASGRQAVRRPSATTSPARPAPAGGATPTRDASAPHGRAPARGGRGAIPAGGRDRGAHASGARGRGGRGGRGRHSPARREERHEPVVRARTRAVQAVTAIVRREPLHLRASAPAYPGGARITAQPAAPARAAGKAERQKPEGMPDYRSEFAGAVAEGGQLYDRVLAAAREIAGSAREQNERLGRTHQTVLSFALRDLDDRLDFERTNLRIGRDTTLQRLRDEAAMFRMLIHGAAVTAYGKLASKRRRYQREIDALDTSGKAIVGRANTGVTGVDDKAKAAEEALDSVLRGAADIYSVDSAFSPIGRARNEAIQTYLPPRVNRRKNTIHTIRVDMVRSLHRTFQCLKCNVDSSRDAFKYATDSVEIPAGRAIDAAAAGGRKAVDDAVEQLEQAVEESYARADDALAEQHDAMRKGAIDSAQQQAGLERNELADSAARQVAALGAVAGAQAQSILRVKATLEKDSAMTEPAFAGAVSRATKRLRANMAGVAAVHPRTTADAARRLSSNRAQRASAFDRQQELMELYSRRSLERIVEQSMGALDRHMDEIMGRLHNVPESVRSSANSSLQPLDDAFFNGLAGYRDSLATLSASIDSVFSRQPADTVPPSPRREGPPARTGAPAGRTAPGGGPAQPGHSLPVPPPPDSCRNCPPADEPGVSVSQGTAADSGPLVCSAETNASRIPPALTLSSQGTVAASVAPRNFTPAPAPNSPYDFNAKNDALTSDPWAPFNEFIDNVPPTMLQAIRTRAHDIHDNLSVMSTNREAIMRQLSGLTRLQGLALEDWYNSVYGAVYGGNLRDDLDSQLRSVWSWGSTDDANVREAKQALDGYGSESGFSGLTAAFNISVEFGRARETLLNMTPQQIAQMRADHGDDLNRMARQLWGEEREIFQALIDGHPERARAIEARRDLDRNDYKQAEERGDANITVIEGVLDENSYAQAIYNDPTPVPRGQEAAPRDILGFEDHEIRRERAQRHIQGVQTEFGFLPGVIDMGGGTSSDMAGSALYHYASRTVDYNLDWYRRYPPPPGSPAERRMRELENQPNPYRREMMPVQKLVIEQMLRHGVDSDEARGARLLRERRRSSGNPDPDGMEKALHIGSGDARESGGYNSAERQRGIQQAEERRDQIFLLSERFRYQLEGGNPPTTDPNVARAQVHTEIASSYVHDERARAVVLGIVEHEEGNLDAVVEYAAAREDTTLLNRYLGRRDRREIDAFAKRYNDTHSVSIEQRLGLFEHHWSWDNMNGAVFSGDTANTLEIAWMGVPQNPQERAEVALRVMDQTIEQSGALGRFLAAGEFTALKLHAAELRRAMGVTPDQVDKRGRIRTHYDPGTGLKISYGHFDQQGNLRQEYTGDQEALEVAAGMARTYASSYTAATDRIASYITTALVVAAAIITTALTGGAAASIWIPMLVTAGAGLVGMGLTAAVKGGRYGRDEMIRDLAMTVVQTITAGIGSAGAIAARGGMPALRMVAGQGIRQGFRISEAALEKALLTKGVTLAATASLGADLAIGAASGAISGGVTAAIDPTNRRSGDYGDRIWGGILRGAAGGAAGAGVARGVGAGLGAAGNKVSGAAASSSAKRAFASGLSREQALEQALRATQRMNWITSGVTRAISSGASGSASRITELGLEGRASFGEIMEEARSAFIQNAVQGAMEHVADPAHRASGRAPAPQEAEPRPAAAPRAETLEAGVKVVQEGPLSPHEIAERAVARTYARPAGEAAAPGTERGAGGRAPPPGEEPPAGRTREEAGAPGRGITDEGAGTALARPRTSAEEMEVAIRAAAGDEADLLRSNIPRSERDTIPEMEAVKPAVAAPEKPISFAELAASRAGPAPGQRVVDSVDLTPEMLGAAHSLPEGSIIKATDPRDAAAAERNYHLMRERDPHREVLLAYHAETGEYAVVQGGMDSVRKPPGGGWIAERHSHPRTFLINDEAAILHALPSGKPGDFGALISEAQALAARPERGGVAVRASKIDIIQPDGSVTETTFAVILQDQKMELIVTFRDPGGAERQLGPYSSIADYGAEVFRLTGTDITAPAERPPPEGAYNLPGSRRSPPVTADDVSAARFVAERMGAAAESPGPVPELLAPPGRQVAPFSAAAEEAHAAVRRMGLVGEPDSLARLTQLLNHDDPSFTPAMRAALANATLEATRVELIRNGQLKPGDDVVMLFRGVTRERLADYEREGMNLSKLGPGKDEDASRGLYGSQDFESAIRYTGDEGGLVLPLIVRQSELGNVIDVRSGTPLGDRWLQYLRASQGKGRIWREHEHLRGVLDPRVDLPIALERDARGTRFEAFLKSVANDPTLPESVRAAARDPHMTMMDLGGVASTGNDRGILTDQWAMHSQHIADKFNEAHGFPVAGREGPGSVPAAGGDEGELMRSNIRRGRQRAFAPGSPQDPAEIAAMARTGPHVDEINAAQRALQHPSLLGARAAIDEIRAGGPNAEAAQLRLNRIYDTPRGAVVVNISDERIAQLSRGLAPGKSHDVMVQGMKLRLYRAAATEANPRPPVRYDAVVPPHVPGKPLHIYQFGEGELRVWRTAPTTDEPAGRIVQSSLVGPGKERKNLEDAMFSQGESYERTAATPIGPQAAGYHGPALERGHLHGAGLGVESPFGIGLVPREVNQTLQNDGIEEWMRRMRDALPPGAELIYSTDVSWHLGSSRHSRIGYKLDIVIEGRRLPFAEFAIHIEADRPFTPTTQRRGTTGIHVSPLEFRHTEYPRVNNYFRALRELVNIPEVLHSGLARSRPQREEVGHSLYKLEPEAIVNLARAAEPWVLASHNPPAAAAFRVTEWESGLGRILDRNMKPRSIVVDLRGLGLSPHQKEQIGAALARLPERHRQRILLLDDRPNYSPQMPPAFHHSLLAPETEDDS